MKDSKEPGEIVAMYENASSLAEWLEAHEEEQDYREELARLGEREEPLTDEEERILAQDAVVDDVAQARDASQRRLGLSEDEIELEMEWQVE